MEQATDLPEIKFLDKPLNILVNFDEILLNNQEAFLAQKPNESITFWIQSQNKMYHAIQSTLLSLFKHQYLVYPITNKELIAKPWSHTTKLLISVTDNQVTREDVLNQPAFESVHKYIASGGYFCVIPVDQVWDSTESRSIETFKTVQFVKLLREQLNPDFVSELDQIQTDLHLPALTEHFFVSPHPFMIYNQKVIIQKALENNRDFKLVEMSPQIADELEQLLKKKVIPIVMCSVLNHPEVVGFTMSEFLCHRDPHLLGQSVIYGSVTRSTHPLVEILHEIDGLTVIARQQVQGRGRGENQWISPPGSLSFSFSFTIDTDSKLFQSAGFVQHLAALSVVKAIKQMCKYPDFEVKIKWPNDVYWRNEFKLAGILTTSKIQGKRAQFFIGIGINLSNDRPTRSLTSLFEEYFKYPPSANSEKLVALVLNHMHELVKSFEEMALDEVIALYCDNWCMSNHTIRLKDGTMAKIIGVDEQGYLKVQNLVDERAYSLHPDGNRFDMIRNLSYA